MNDLKEHNVLLKAVDIHKSFVMGKSRIDVLTGIDLEIRRGEIVSIVGASGVGKSTLLYILGALERPSRGQVRIESRDVFSLSDNELARCRNRYVGFVFQFHHLMPEFTALENVAMPSLINRRNPTEAYEAAQHLLEEVGLSHRTRHKPGELSGGELQRVALARALANSPRIIMADEPSGNLDRSSGEALHHLMWTLSRSKGQTFIVVTHNEDLADQADRKIRLADGIIHIECDRLEQTRPRGEDTHAVPGL